MPNVLVADDDAVLLDALALLLEESGFGVRTVGDGVACLAAVEREPPDVLVCDVMMPHLDGFTVVRRVRARSPDLPILMLTSRDTELDEALGFELGADDYVTKPFRNRVLVARIHALLRRSQARATPAGATATQTVGPLHLDLDRIDVRWRDHAITTTMTEFRLLRALSSRPGVVRDRDWLLQQARDDDSVVDARIIDTYVRRLRRKLEAVDSTFGNIETVVGAGYRWRDGL